MARRSRSCLRRCSGTSFRPASSPATPSWPLAIPPPWTPAPEAKSPDTRIEFQATLHDLVNGRTVLTDIPRQVGCQACNATGFHPNAALRQCRRCDGRGYQTSTQSSYGLFTHTQSTCASCGGAGSKMSSDDCCAQCRGSCLITETAVVEWEIAKGMLPGQTITLPGMGNALPGHLPGDVVIRLRVAPHPAFEIVPPDSRDLLLSVSITLSEALLGMDRVLFRHLDGREIRILSARAPPGRPPGHHPRRPPGHPRHGPSPPVPRPAPRRSVAQIHRRIALPRLAQGPRSGPPPQRPASLSSGHPPLRCSSRIRQPGICCRQQGMNFPPPPSFHSWVSGPGRPPERLPCPKHKARIRRA
ncbi:hypothetical protein PTTG_28638 [Puccinia triticina 1-1 BBBD Race 1]|uniref:CR-type domain-containing protein n=1 Tax=Puccinia triticina (isolate 1-1 / race 1 (BBBD)) TaxID=630390 RepID=A0A180GBA1_PUCT1|nr:hypothetical protein PTTG_28638 [Puccinia triticina 1-1 BBBD Race 1]